MRFLVLIGARSFVTIYSARQKKLRFVFNGRGHLQWATRVCSLFGQFFVTFVKQRYSNFFNMVLWNAVVALHQANKFIRGYKSKAWAIRLFENVTYLWNPNDLRKFCWEKFLQTINYLPIITIHRCFFDTCIEGESEFEQLAPRVGYSVNFSEPVIHGWYRWYRLTMVLTYKRKLSKDTLKKRTFSTFNFEFFQFGPGNKLQNNLLFLATIFFSRLVLVIWI